MRFNHTIAYPSSRLARYSCAVLVITAAALVELALGISGTGVTSLFLGAIMVSTWFGGIGPGLLSTLLSSMVLAVVFMEPAGSLRFGEDDFPRLIVFLLAAGLIGWLHHLTRRSQERLAEANRAKERFLAMLSHELRTPLSPVLALASAQEEDTTLTQAAREDASLIRRNIEIEVRLIDDLLDANRLSSSKVAFQFQTIALTPLLEDVLAMCRPDIEARHITLAAELCESLYLKADPVRLRQVVWNLLRNATKFTPPGGRILVKCRQTQDGRAMLCISDTGIGIPAEALPRIFAPFEQSSQADVRKAGGLGLGLAIARMIIDAHGGTAHASSGGEGQGATFTVMLPLVEAPVTTPQVTADQPNATPAGTATPLPLRILLVEDHADAARVMCRLLQRDGHTVAVAGDVRGALETIGAKSFDLLISDLGLPDASGLDLMRQVRQTHPHVPGIALSGHGTASEIEAGRVAGFASYLVKPVTLSQLRRTIAATVSAGPLTSSPA